VLAWAADTPATATVSRDLTSIMITKIRFNLEDVGNTHCFTTYTLLGRESLLGMFNPAMVAICELHKIAVVVAFTVVAFHRLHCQKRRLPTEDTHWVVTSVNNNNTCITFFFFFLFFFNAVSSLYFNDKIAHVPILNHQKT
jgi:hypothetical protein